VPVDRDDAEERKARIEMILEELRLNTETCANSRSKPLSAPDRLRPNRG